MKKVISILLCALLLIGSFAFSVSAEETRNTVAYGNADGSKAEIQYSADWGDFTNNTDYVIRSGCTFVIPSGLHLAVPVTSTLTVEEGAALYINGSLNVMGEAHIYGKLDATESGLTGQQNVLCYVSFPDLTGSLLAEKIQVKCYKSNESEDYGDINVSFDNYLSVYSNGTVQSYNSNLLPVPYNTFLYIRVFINEAQGEDRYDDKLVVVKCNGVAIPFAQNGCPIQVTTGSEITFGNWVNDSAYYNTYIVELPEGEGYTVYGRNGEIGKVTLKYGQSFSFRVELEEEFNKSDYAVYVYNGLGFTNLDKDDLLEGIEPAVADAEGYYTIDSVTGNYSISVQGVVSNQMLDIFSQVFNVLKQVWETVMQIFNELFGEGGLGNLFG